MLYLKRLRHILQSKYLFKILVGIFLIYSILFTNLYTFKSKYKIDDNTFIGIIYDYKIDDKDITLYIKAKEKIIVKYKSDNLTFDKISLGDKLLIKGVITSIDSSTIPNTFDYKKYLYRKGIYYIVEANSINKIDNNNNYIYTIKNILQERINKYKSYLYMKIFILGDNELDSDINDSYRVNGVSHLFSISGTYVNFITSIIYLYLDRVTKRRNIKYVIVDIFLVLYLLICFSSSLLRSIIMYILFSINNIFKLNIRKIDIMFITLIMGIIINPFIIYDIGFIYSYIISFFLVMFSYKVRGKNKIYRFIYITVLSFLVGTPITIYNSYEINIFSIFINIIIVPIVSLFIFPLTFITFIFPVFDDILYITTGGLENLSLYLSSGSFKIIFCRPNIVAIVIYYIIIINVLTNIFKNKKMTIVFVMAYLLFMITWKCIPYLDSNFNVVMLDVGEGDCIFIKAPWGMGNILIDTGNSYEDYSVMESKVMPYLKSRGISRINYLIISHGDADHIGGALSLVKDFNVNNVILNKGEYSNLEMKLINILKKKKIYFTSDVDKINIREWYIYFLNNKLFDNENDNSIINYFKINSYSFLFMGDSSFVVEDYLLEEYNLKDITFLKVGHHGSDTSSSREFIDSINPVNALISVGKNNRYGHPNKEVLNNLNNSKIYRTDQDGSIMFKIKNNKLKIETCSP